MQITVHTPTVHVADDFFHIGNILAVDGTESVVYHLSTFDIY